jgi:hypothetical protein
MLARFQKAGGVVKWSKYDEKCVEGEFSHPSGGSVKICWDINMANKAGITGNPTWKKYPRAMLRSRCISEGIRTVFPGVISGFYTEEEVESFTQPASRNIKDRTIDSECVDVSVINNSGNDEVNHQDALKSIQLQFVDEATILRAQAEKCIERQDEAVLKMIVMDWYILCYKYTTENHGFSVPQKWAEGMHKLLMLEKPVSIQKGYIDFGADNIVHLDEVVAVKTYDSQEKEAVNF